MCCTLFYHCFPPSRSQQSVTRWGTSLCHHDPPPCTHTLPSPFPPNPTLSKCHPTYAWISFMYKIIKLIIQFIKCLINTTVTFVWQLSIETFLCLPKPLLVLAVSFQNALLPFRVEIKCSILNSCLFHDFNKQYKLFKWSVSLKKKKTMIIKKLALDGISIFFILQFGMKSVI